MVEIDRSDPLLELFGYTAWDEYRQVQDWQKRILMRWWETTKALPDDHFYSVVLDCMRRSLDAPWDEFETHFKVYSCMKLSRERHEAAGHGNLCEADTIYDRAYKDLRRSYGHEVSESSPCDCLQKSDKDEYVTIRPRSNTNPGSDKHLVARYRDWVAAADSGSPVRGVSEHDSAEDAQKACDNLNKGQTTE
jgi:hypothetical protein